MPVWRQCAEGIVPGDILGECVVVEVKRWVPPNVTLRNNNIRKRRDLFTDADLEPEVPVPFARVVRWPAQGEGGKNPCGSA